MVQRGRGFLKSDRTAQSAEEKLPGAGILNSLTDFWRFCCRMFNFKSMSCFICTSNAGKSRQFGLIHQTPPNSHWLPLNPSSPFSPKNWNHLFNESLLTENPVDKQKGTHMTIWATSQQILDHSLHYSAGFIFIYFSVLADPMDTFIILSLQIFTRIKRLEMFQEF